MQKHNQRREHLEKHKSQSRNFERSASKPYRQMIGEEKDLEREIKNIDQIQKIEGGLDYQYNTQAMYLFWY